ncbi:MAG TPA: LamG-like jellyroll fold domain-containing protein, partial [Phycisphaerae bacterium]|nr:LamG-like jellyroll fold domain-containing protein [Phycisphaerae bacterium]
GPVWATGVLDGALSFDGTNDHVSVPSSPDLGGGSFTLTAWILPLGTWDRKIFTKWDDGTQRLQTEWQVFRDNKLWFGVGQADETYRVARGTTVPAAGQWHHVAAVADANASELRLYIDGARETLQADPGWDGTIRSVDIPLYIGRTFASTNYWNGCLDDVRIYNKALTGGEILDLVNLPLAAACVDDDNTTGVEDGTPAHPFDTIQEAVDAVSDGGTVKVAQGTYTATGSQVVAVQNKTVFLRGGYAGGADYATTPGDFGDASRDWEANVTTIDGETARGCVRFDNAAGELSGFVVTNGFATGEWPDGCGAGMLNVSSSPTLTHVTFTGNQASQYGGAVYNEGSSPTLTEVTFTGNQADCGGGMYNYVSSSPTLTHVTFSGNRAAQFGGAMCTDTSSATLTEVIFTGNQADWSGGGMFNWSASPTLARVTFSGNQAGSDGGGMSNNCASNPTLRNSILWGNEAPTGPEIYNDGTGSATATYSDVQGGHPGNGNLDQDPLFAAPGHWEAGSWVEGDYHLKSQAGRYDPATGTFVGTDLVTSPCIDAGDPADPVGDEPAPNGARVNMGAYAGTAQASKTALLWFVDVLAPDPAAGGTTDPGVGTYTHTLGDAAVVTAYPAAGWALGHWEIDGAAAGSGNPLIVASGTSGQTTQVQAFFVQETWTLEVLAPDPVTGGTTVPGVGTHTCNVTEDASVAANPATGWKVGHWEIGGADAGSDSPLTVPSGAADETRQVRVFFVPARDLSAPAVETPPGDVVDVPVTLSDGADVIALDITVTWTDSIIQLAGVQKGAATEDWTLTPSPGAGSVAISLFHTQALPAGPCEVAILRFTAVGQAGHISPVHFAAASANEDEFLLATSDGSVTLVGHSIGGNVTYYGGAQAAVPGATLTLSGDHAAATNTDATGAYSFSGVPSGNITNTPSRAPDPESPPRGLSSLDAAYVAQAVVGLRTFTDHQRLAGDVTGNGTLSSLDAARIAQRVVGLIGQFSVPDFLFDPADRSYAPLSQDETGQDFVMIRTGDVTGNWTPGVAGLGSAALGAGEWERTVSIPQDLTVAPGGSVEVPVSVDDARGLLGCDLEVTYDPAVVVPVGVRKALVSEPAALAYRVDEARSRVVISLHGSVPLLGAGSLVSVEFQAVGSLGDASVLGIERASLNEGQM